MRSFFIRVPILLTANGDKEIDSYITTLTLQMIVCQTPIHFNNQQPQSIMPGNSKPRKAKSSPKVKAPNVATRSVIANYLNPNSFVSQSSKLALECVRRIVNGVGNFDDWSKVMHRFYAGSIAYTDYFKPDDGLAQTINYAVASMQLIMVRTHCIGVDGFGMRPTEQDRVIKALEVIDVMMRNMYPEEVMRAYSNAGYYIEDFIACNKKASDLFYEKQAMLKTLSEEYKEVAQAA